MTEKIKEEVCEELHINKKAIDGNYARIERIMSAIDKTSQKTAKATIGIIKERLIMDTLVKEKDIDCLRCQKMIDLNVVLIEIINEIKEKMGD